MVPDTVVARILAKIEDRVAKLLDTEEDTVCIHDVRVIHRLLIEQRDMAEKGLLYVENTK